MAYGSISGRARTHPDSPQAHAICDRCGFRYNLVDLSWQHDWRGTSVQNLRILVCRTCTDELQAQLRAIRLPPDPVGVRNPRPENFVAAATAGAPLPPSNYAIDIDPNAVMPFSGDQAYGKALNLLSVMADGSTNISVTCGSAHGLMTNSQVVVAGLEMPVGAAACGLFNVSVGGPMGFTFQAAAPVVAGSLLTTTTRITTALVGVPYGYPKPPGFDGAP